MKYKRVYRFRLTPEEEEQLAAEAAERGVSKADRIREALGWETNEVRSLPPGATATLLDAAPEKPTADPETEPGKASIEELGRLARERLTSP